MRVFMVMPFDETSTENYHDLIKPMFEREGCEIYRTDELSSHQNIIKDIVRGIYEADLIVAEITLINANVYYELGIAHGLNKPTILITQNVAALPFDLRSYRVLSYSTHWRDVERLKSDIRVALNALKTGFGEFGNPVSDWLVDHPISESGENHSQEKSNQQVQKSDIVTVEELGKLAEVALQTIVLSIMRLTELAYRFTGQLMNDTVRIRSLKFVSQADIEKFEQFVAETGLRIDEFAEGMIVEIPIVHTAWEQVRTSVSAIFKKAEIRTDGDLVVVNILLHGVAQALSGLESMINQLKIMRNEALQGMLGKFKNLDLSIIRAQDALFDLIEVYSIGEAYLVRTRSLADEAIARSTK